jgi:hypothetical protein
MKANVFVFTSRNENPYRNRCVFQSLPNTNFYFLRIYINHLSMLPLSTLKALLAHDMRIVTRPIASSINKRCPDFEGIVMHDKMLDFIGRKSTPRTQITCFRCHQSGHYRVECFFWRTLMCTLTGCPRGDECRYAHSLDELRQIGVRSHPRMEVASKKTSLM